MERNESMIEKETEKPQELSTLLENALKQPGIQAIMEVYESWKKFDSVRQYQQQALALRRVISLSNSSTSGFPTE